MRILQSALVAFTVSICATVGQAAVTLEFDGVPDGEIGCPPNPTSVFEAGFEITNCPGHFVNTGAIHLDDGGSPFEGLVGFTGRVFDAISVVLNEQGWEYFDDFGGLKPYDNVIFRGFRGAALVAEQAHSTLGRGVHSVAFTGDFTRLTNLEIEQVRPNDPDPFACDAPCAHVDVNSVTLAAVPLPASALGMAMGALGLGAMGLGRKLRRKRLGL